MNAEASDVVNKKTATIYESVTMTDGRVVEFAGKKKMLKSYTISPDGVVTVRLDFRNGATRDFVLPSSLILQFAGHGAEQKLGDEVAGVDDIDDMIEYEDELMARLAAGEWSIRREGGGPMAGQSILLKALLELANGKKTIEELREFLKGKSNAEKQALRKSAQLSPIVERLEAEKAAKGKQVDTDALLGELGV